MIINETEIIPYIVALFVNINTIINYRTSQEPSKAALLRSLTRE